MSASRIDAFLLGLVAQFDAALDIPVFDGPHVVDGSLEAGLWVGASLDDNQPAIQGTHNWANLHATARRVEEIGEVTCVIAVWSGDSKTIGRRARAIELWNLAEAAHRADITVGGTVLDSTFALTYSMRQELTESGGNLVALSFAVQFRARI